MTALNFRRAIEADIPVIWDIRFSVTENVLSDPTVISHQMCVDYLDELGCGWVCEKDGVIIGFSYAAKQDSSIWALFVRPGQEGQGAGKQLLRLAVDFLFALGNDEVKLGTQANSRADRFYAAQGWKNGGMKNEVEVAYTLRRPAVPGGL